MTGQSRRQSIIILSMDMYSTPKLSSSQNFLFLKTCAKPECPIRMVLNCYEGDFAMVEPLKEDIIVPLQASRFIQEAIWPTLAAMFVLSSTLET